MIPLSHLTRVFARIGVLSFGGPAAQIALMHKELVEDRPWLSEAQFLRALSFCMMLPGPEAMQLATYAGWRIRGVVGGLIAGGLFVLPGAAVILALALLYASYGDLPVIRALFVGVQATVVVLVVQAIVKLAGKVGLTPGHVAIAALAFVALFVFGLPFPVVVVAAALWGAVTAAGGDPSGATRSFPPMGAALRIGAVFAALWAAPLCALALWGYEDLLTLGVFFSKMSAVSFGGAYALLAYMTQEVVSHHGWLTAPQMMDALGLAETTPGPLILVTQFVGHLAGNAFGGTGGLIAAGALTLWVTFVPCFLWIFAGAPLIDWLDGQPRLSGALTAISSAVLGVIANLSLWFSIHVLFARTGVWDTGPIAITYPHLTSLRWDAALLVIAAWALLGPAKWPLPRVLPVMALVGLGLGMF